MAEFRVGFVKAVVLPVKTVAGVRYTVKVCRLFKDVEAEWNETDVFSPEDLPLLEEVSRRAQFWISEKMYENHY